MRERIGSAIGGFGYRAYGTAGLFGTRSLRSLSDANSKYGSDIFIPPKLPVLDAIVAHTKKSDFVSLKKTAVIGVQHLLPSTASLFESMIELGMLPENMFFKGKFYSTDPNTEQYLINRGIQIVDTKVSRWPGHYRENTREEIKEMWQIFEAWIKNSNIERVIVLDDGGMCLESIPDSIYYDYDLAGIEQTRFGFYNPTIKTQLMPFVDIAQSAAKINLESPLIADGVLRRIKKVMNELDINEAMTFGVVGNGAIGSAITRYLLSLDKRVVIYDESHIAFQGIRHKKCIRVDTVEKVIGRANVVFGCTGKDITKNIENVPALVREKCVFVSCSSQDIEFLTLLKQISRTPNKEMKPDSIMRLTYTGDAGQEISVTENGCPVNFDRTGKCDLPEDMSITRSELLGGFIQAVKLAKKPIEDGVTANTTLHYMLDPALQKFAVSIWKKGQPEGRYSKEELNCFDDEEWIASHSKGTYYTTGLFNTVPSELNPDTPSPKRTCGAKH